MNKMSAEHRVLMADTIVNAYETGMLGNWAACRWVDSHGNRVANGALLIDDPSQEVGLFVVERHDDGTDGKRLVIYPDTAWRNLQEMLNSTTHQHLPRIAGEILSEDGDAATDDCLIQFCLFKEIVYG